MPPPATKGKDLARTVDLERVPFYGTRLPTNIVAMKKAMKAISVERATFQRLVRFAVSYIEGKVLKPEMFGALVTDDIPLDKVHIIYSGVLKIVQAAFRCSSASITKESFLYDLNSLNMNVSKEMIDDLSSAVFGSRRQVLEQATIMDVPRRPTISSFQWRIDVAISTTTLSRVLEPAVSVRMTLCNGEVKCFELSVTKFQELRYHVATVMKEMEHLENRSILKIQD